MPQNPLLPIVGNLRITHRAWGGTIIPIEGLSLGYSMQQRLKVINNHKTKITLYMSPIVNTPPRHVLVLML